MPLIEVNDVSLCYEEHGDATESVVFVHGLLMNRHMFDAQIEALKSRYRCIAFDLRGQGESEVTRSGYDMDNLTRDTAALIEALDNYQQQAVPTGIIEILINQEESPPFAGLPSTNRQSPRK